MNLSSTQDVLENLQSTLVLPPHWRELTDKIADWDDSVDPVFMLQQEGLLTAYQADGVRQKDRPLFLGSYRLLEELPTAGSDRVFRAEHVFLQTAAAIRLREIDSPQRDRILNFAWHRLGQLRLPIVPIVDLGWNSDLETGRREVYFVSPFVEGQNLVERITRHGPLKINKACALVYELAMALAESHRQRLAHGWVTPASVRTSSQQQLRLVDFGLRLASAETRFEHLVQADLRGLGGILYWTLTGRPIGAESDRWNWNPSHPWIPLRSLRTDVPAALDDFLKALFVQSGEASCSAEAFMQALLPFVQPEESETVASGTNESSSQPLLAIETRRVLVVDDEPTIRHFCKLALHEIGLACDEAENGRVGLEAFQKNHYDLILLDIDMPVMNGLEVCRQVRQLPGRPHLKIVLFSGRMHPDAMAQTMLSGVDDFLAKPFSPDQLLARVQAALRLQSAQERSDSLNRDLLALNRELEKHLSNRDSDLVQARNALVLALAKLAEYRDSETGAHLQRLQRFAQCLGTEVLRHPLFAERIDQHYVDLLACCAPLHDIGKVGLPDHILLKPARLTTEERLLMQAHTTIGAETLKQVAQQHGFARAFLNMAIDIARHHHERFDGLGYPDRLANCDIPLSARIVSLCDVYDALRSRRVYKPALPHAIASRMILQGEGTQFDPGIVRCFENCEAEFERIYRDAGD